MTELGQLQEVRSAPVSSRGARDHEPAPAGCELAPRNIDGDGLLALGREPVEQERHVEIAAGGAEAGAVGGKRGELVLAQQPAVMQQASDQHRLAVIDRAAGKEPQQHLSPAARHLGVRPCSLLQHQK